MSSLAQKCKWVPLFLTSLGFFLVLELNSTAAAAEEGTLLKFNEFVKEVSIKGDFRLRQEFIHRSDQNGTSTPNASNRNDRQRQRFRVRLNLDLKLPQNVETKFQFATGAGEQVSTNQSFDNLSNEKGFWIDRAYLLWSPSNWGKFAAGKTNNPFWTPYSYDVIYDTDFNPEGAYEKLEFFGPFRTKLFFNALQMVVDEDSAGTADQYMFAQQLGFESLVFDQSKFTLAVGVHEWVNERVGTFGQVSPASYSNAVGQDGNRRTGNVSTGTLTNEFRPVDLTAEYNTFLWNVPVSVQGTYVHNNKAFLNPDEDKGFQYGGIFGKANDAKTWELAYFYKRVEADATISDIADSDFGDAGGTNRKGHIFWLAFSPTNWMRFQAKQFVTRPIEESLIYVGGSKQVNRTQIDLVVKF